MVELIIHPGAGKTGTTTIQNFLKNQYESLLSQRIGYLGMSFENTVEEMALEENGAELSSLKHRLGGEINKRPREVLEFSLTQIRQYLEKNPNVDILVWSNESLMNQHNWIWGLKEGLEELTRLKVIYGVRDPSNWIVSAYFQWGGNSDFKDFAVGRSLANPGKKWEKVSDEFRLLDIDGEPNIIKAFSAMIGYMPPKNQLALRQNRTIDKGQFSKEKSLRYSDLLTSDKILRGWVERESSGIRDLNVDPGAVTALQAGKSLLPAGVRAVSGQFGRGEPVRIEGPDGAELGKGLIRYTAEEARAIAGHRSGDIAGILGYPGRAALIHRDDMAL